MSKALVKYILHREKLFKTFMSKMLSQETNDVLNEIAKDNEVFVLSGIIRDFLTGNTDNIRDIDFVIRKRIKINLPISFLRKFVININSFGGLKLKSDVLTIDVWYMDDSWGLKKKKLNSTPNALIDTVFFNFSNIIFDYKNEKFIFGDFFLRFLESHIMDIVYDENPNIPLCIINTLYYKRKYDYKISKRLSSWILFHFDRSYDFYNVQLAHFGKVLYSNKEINTFIGQLKKYV